MSDALRGYLELLDQARGLPKVYDDAVATAERAGREEIDQAERLARQHHDDLELALRELASIQIGLRQLEQKTGPVDTERVIDVPTDPALIRRRVESLTQDLKSALQAQQWVENHRMRAVVLKDELNPAPPEPALEAQLAVEPVSAVRQGVSPVVLGAGIAGVLVLILVVVLVII